MTLPASPEPLTVPSRTREFRPAQAVALLSGLWGILFFASLFAPPILDDADGTHASAARQMLLSGDWVTLRVNNVRYLEKAPLPYWLDAISFRVFGFNAFAAHLPQVIGVLILALLGFYWSRRAFDDRTALYAGIAVLTSAGVFLFTRVFIPDALLSLFLAVALYCFINSLDTNRTPNQSSRSAYAMWVALALAVLTKGLVAIVFLFGAGAVYLILSGEYLRWKRLKPVTGALLFLAIAAPWHILAGLRNTGGMNGHGFFWFYFINEHVLRFLGRRIPMDYNKLPGYLYWSSHLVWLFPWSLFAPLLAIPIIRHYRDLPMSRGLEIPYPAPSPKETRISQFILFLILAGTLALKIVLHISFISYVIFAAALFFPVRYLLQRYCDHRRLALQLDTFKERTVLLLTLFSGLVLLFFSLSTNQGYYTFPAYLPLLMLLAAALATAERTCSTDQTMHRWLTFAHAAFTTVGVVVAIALFYGLWTARHIPFVSDIGELLAHRGVGNYTLSMSSLFDLTGRSFAALRLPAFLAMCIFAIGPAIAWILRRQRRHLASTMAIAFTSAAFLIAAHIALERFAPMLSSEDMAAKIKHLENSGAISRDNTFLLYGDQAYGSSIPFYLDRPLNQPALLVDGRSSSMLFGSTFPDAQYLFVSPKQLLASWGKGKRKLLFVPLEHRDDVDRLLGDRQIVIKETSGKALVTDRPLRQPPAH